MSDDKDKDRLIFCKETGMSVRPSALQWVVPVDSFDGSCPWSIGLRGFEGGWFVTDSELLDILAAVDPDLREEYAQRLLLRDSKKYPDPDLEYEDEDDELS